MEQGLSVWVSSFPALLTAIGGLAVLTSAITEATKNIGWLRRIPTDAQVLALSLLLSLAALLAWAELAGARLTWYMLAGGVCGGLLVAFIAMYGWATWFDLVQRFDHRRHSGGEEADE